MKIGIHQPNLIPWLPFFYKIQQSDIFVLMINCQFEKNGFQNRANVNGKWWTLPVRGGTELLKDKLYVNGEKMVDVNVPLILGICRILSIDTSKIHYDITTSKKGTDRIIDICKFFKADEYLTNPDATNKYLDEKAMNNSGIEVVPCDLPSVYKKSLFESLDEFGIDGCTNIIRKQWQVAKK